MAHDGSFYELKGVPGRVVHAFINRHCSCQVCFKMNSTGLMCQGFLQRLSASAGDGPGTPLCSLPADIRASNSGGNNVKKLSLNDLTVKESEMDQSVYKIIEVVGMSEKSWEEAAKTAIATVDNSVRDIRVAEVIEMDMRLESNRIVAYRVKLKVSFKLE